MLCPALSPSHQRVERSPRVTISISPRRKIRVALGRGLALTLPRPHPPLPFSSSAACLSTSFVFCVNSQGGVVFLIDKLMGAPRISEVLSVIIQQNPFNFKHGQTNSGFFKYFFSVVMLTHVRKKVVTMRNNRKPGFVLDRDGSSACGAAARCLM